MVGRMDDDGVSRVCHFLKWLPPRREKQLMKTVCISKQGDWDILFVLKTLLVIFAIEKSLFSERIIPKGTM